MRFYYACNLIEQELREKKETQGNPGNRRSQNRAKVNRSQIESISQLYNDSVIVSAVIDQILRDIDSGHIVIDEEAADGIKNSFKKNKGDDTAYKEMLMHLGLEFCRNIILYQMCILSIPRTLEEPFVSPIEEYRIEFEQLMSGGRKYFVSHIRSDKDRFEHEPIQILCVARAPSISGMICSPISKLVEDYNLACIRRALSFASDMQQIVPMVYASGADKPPKEEDKIPGFTSIDESVRLQQEEKEEEEKKKGMRTGATTLPPTEPLIKMSTLLNNIIRTSPEKTPLERIVNLLEVHNYKAVTVVEVEDKKLTQAGRPTKIEWSQDQEQLMKSVSMSIGYPFEMWKSESTKVSSAAENSKEKKEKCLRSYTKKIESFLTFLVSEDYTEVANNYNKELKQDDLNDPFRTVPLKSTGLSSDTPLPRYDPNAGSYSSEFNAPGHLPVVSGPSDNSKSEADPEVPLKPFAEPISNPVLEQPPKQSKKRKQVRIIHSIPKDELLELDSFGRVEGSAMQMLLAEQFGGSPDWFNKEAKLPAPPPAAGAKPVGGAKRKKSSGAKSSKKKKKKSKSTKPKKPAASSTKKKKKKPTTKSVNASRYGFNGQMGPAVTDVYDDEEEEDEDEEEDDSEDEEQEEDSEDAGEEEYPAYPHRELIVEQSRNSMGPNSFPDPRYLPITGFTSSISTNPPPPAHISMPLNVYPHSSGLPELLATEDEIRKQIFMQQVARKMSTEE